MKERLVKNWVTTVCGLVLFVIGAVLVYTQKIEWDAYIASMSTIFLLFRAKDSLIGINRDK